MVVYVSSDAEGNEYSPYDETTHEIIDQDGNAWNELDVKNELAYGTYYTEKDFTHIAILWRI